MSPPLKMGTARYASFDRNSITEKEDEKETTKSKLPRWMVALAVDPTLAMTASTAATGTMNPVWQHFLETLITWGVPTSLVAVSVAGLAVARSRKPRPKKKPKKASNPATELYDDLYVKDKDSTKNRSRADEITELLRDLASSSQGFNKKKNLLRKNQGIPSQEYITMTYWNQTLDSYQYSLTAATQSRAQAAAQYRQQTFDRALKTSILTSDDPVSPHTRAKMLALEQDFLDQGSKLVQTIQRQQTKLTRKSIQEEMDKMGVEPYEMDPKDSDDEKGEADKKENEDERVQNVEKDKNVEKNNQDEWAVLQEAQRKLMELELQFIQDLVSILGTKRATGIRLALLGDVAARGTGGLLTQVQERPLSTMLEYLENRKINGETSESSVSQIQQPKCLYVTRFPGDTRASQVEKLREEITAIVRNATPGDEVLIVLASGGGTVTGYGLAAGQLQRVKQAGLKLTVVVEQVAASGGYMMCCVGDRIIGSPFAAFGSIGVITEIPNFHSRLKREGV